MCTAACPLCVTIFSTVVSCKYAPLGHKPPLHFWHTLAEVFYPVHKPPLPRKRLILQSKYYLANPLGCLPLKCLPWTWTAHIKDGHASYFEKAPCFFIPLTLKLISLLLLHPAYKPHALHFVLRLRLYLQVLVVNSGFKFHRVTWASHSHVLLGEVEVCMASGMLTGTLLISIFCFVHLHLAHLPHLSVFFFFSRPQ